MPPDEHEFRFGIWLETPPYMELLGEGIFRVLSAILESAAKAGNGRPVVAMAKWTEEGFRKLLKEHDIPESSVEIVVSRRRVPILVRLAHYLRRLPTATPRPPLMRRVLQALWNSPLIGGLCRRLLSQKSVLSWLLYSVLNTDSYVVFALLVVPAAMIGLVLWLVRTLCRVVVAKLWSNAASIFRRLHQSWLSGRQTLPRGGTAQAKMYKRLIDHEYVVLARRLSRNKDVSVWFVPHPAWAQSGRIAAPLVVSVPDIVYADFPSVFAPEVFEPAMRRIRQLVGRAKMVISYSEYVRERHVVKYLGAPPERTTVIRHAAMPVSRHLSQIVKQWGGNSRMAARSLIQDFLDSRDNPLICPPSREYRRRFPFDEIPYLFVSSQVRAHKNYLNLFRAFEHLLRRKYLNLKLVMTGCLHDDAGLRQYVISNGLELDILSIPNMPNDVHAAFYHLAALTVTPPLFEGGLPFPFTESLSVGTPIVMSSIPVTREAIPPDLAEVMLFDPYDVDDIASRIAWAVQHRDELIAMQMPLYEGLCRRSWSDVAQEYLSVFRRAAGVAAPALTNSRPHA